MATYWVRPAPDGSDDNAGTSHALAKATLSGVLAIAGVATTAGHIVNIVAGEGSHVMEAFPATAVNAVGTNYTSNPGIIIQGVDASGNPAIATVAAEVGKRIWVRIGGAANYTLIKGIKFDYTALAGDTTNLKIPINYSLFSGLPSSRNHRVHDCECWFSSTVGSAVTVAETVLPVLASYNGTSGISSGMVDVYNCVLVHSRLSVNQLVGPDTDIHHNVLIWDAASTGSAVQMMLGLPGTPSDTIRVFSNTFVQRRYGATLVTSCFYDTATDRPVLSFYDNLLYTECSATASTPGVAAFIAQGATQAVSSGGSVGNNVFVTGVNLSAFIAGAWNNQTYGYTSFQLNEVWRGGNTAGWLGTDVGATSLAVTGAAFASAFYDTTQEYEWTPGDYTHTLPYDLRPMYGRTSSTTGGVVGALDEAIIVEVPPETEDPDEGVGRNYLDSYPFYKPLFKATTETMFKLKRNRVNNHVDMRHYLQEHVHDESMSRVVQIAAAGVFTCGFGGVHRATGLLLETDQELSVVVSHYNGIEVSTFTVTVDQLLALSQCRVTQVVITNTSASAANVHVVAFD